MKRYRTPNQLIYCPVGIMEKMIVRLEQHRARYGCYPKIIYLPKDIYNEYESIVWKHHLIQFRGRMPIYFRGIPVYKL